MVTLAHKIKVEQHMRALLDDHGLTQPDRVEYDEACVRLIWLEDRLCLVIDIEETEAPEKGVAMG